jgi:hypothetical protein
MIAMAAACEHLGLTCCLDRPATHAATLQRREHHARTPRSARDPRIRRPSTVVEHGQFVEVGLPELRDDPAAFGQGIPLSARCQLPT